MMWKRLNRFYPILLEVVLVVLIVLSFWYPLVHLSEMPARIPSHFGPSGLPDAWQVKSMWSILTLPIIIASIYLGMGAITLYLTLVSDAKKVINLPRNQLERMSVDRAELIRLITVRYLFAIKALVVVMQVYLSVGQTRVSLGLAQGLGWPMWLFFFGILALCGIMTVRLMLLMPSKET